MCWGLSNRASHNSFAVYKLDLELGEDSISRPQVCAQNSVFCIMSELISQEESQQGTFLSARYKTLMDVWANIVPGARGRSLLGRTLKYLL